MFGVVGQPDLIRPLGTEVPLHEIIGHGRARLLAAPTTTPDDAGRDLLERTQPLAPVLRRPVACRVKLIGDRPVAELRISLVQVDNRGHQMRVGVPPSALPERVLFRIGTAINRMLLKPQPKMKSLNTKPFGLIWRTS